ncbi:jg5231, partial [Pararge aegeria aegeria]
MEFDCERVNLVRVVSMRAVLEVSRRPQIMTGEYSAFESIRGKYTSWFDVLGGWLLFTAP